MLIAILIVCLLLALFLLGALVVTFLIARELNRALNEVDR